MTILREPLLHFVLIGAILFGLFTAAQGDGEALPGEIVVSSGQIASIKAIHSRTWQRQPSPEELDALVADHIRDEVLYREAIAMGLDKDDVVIRRRMRQKMEFVADAMAEAEPTDAELKDYVAKHPESFRSEPRFSFSHVYFKSEGATGPEGLLRALTNGTASAAETGDPFIAGYDFEHLSPSDVAQIFGEPFASSLEASPLDAWAGPVRSAYGMHLVHVSERVDAAQLPFEQVRETARREWLNARHIAASDALFETLRSRYEIRVENESEERLAEAAP
jgi:PPIC-type PPIASE domain